MLWPHKIISHVYRDGNDGQSAVNQKDVLGFTTVKCTMN